MSSSFGPSLNEVIAERDAYRAALEGLSANATECEGCRLMVRVASTVLLAYPQQCKHARTICAECRFPASSWPERRAQEKVVAVTLSIPGMEEVKLEGYDTTLVEPMSMPPEWFRDAYATLANHVALVDNPPDPACVFEKSFADRNLTAVVPARTQENGHLLTTIKFADAVLGVDSIETGGKL